jgi:hypothetical protein
MGGRVFRSTTGISGFGGLTVGDSAARLVHQIIWVCNWGMKELIERQVGHRPVRDFGRIVFGNLIEWEPRRVAGSGAWSCTQGNKVVSAFWGDCNDHPAA